MIVGASILLAGMNGMEADMMQAEAREARAWMYWLPRTSAIITTNNVWSQEKDDRHVEQRTKSLTKTNQDQPTSRQIPYMREPIQNQEDVPAPHRGTVAYQF